MSESINMKTLTFCFGYLGATPVCMSAFFGLYHSFFFLILNAFVYHISLSIFGFCFVLFSTSNSLMCLSFGTDFSFSTPSFRAFSPFSILSHSLSPWQVSEFLVLALILAGSQPILGAHWQPLKALSAWKMLQEEDRGGERGKGREKRKGP